MNKEGLLEGSMMKKFILMAFAAYALAACANIQAEPWFGDWNKSDAIIAKEVQQCINTATSTNNLYSCLCPDYLYAWDNYRRLHYANQLAQQGLNFPLQHAIEAANNWHDQYQAIKNMSIGLTLAFPYCYLENQIIVRHAEHAKEIEHVCTFLNGKLD